MPEVNFHRTDMGNGQRFAAMHRGAVHYCYQWKKWLTWDGKRWSIDDAGKIHRLCKKTVRSMYTEAAEAAEQEQREALAKWAVKSEHKNRIDAMRACAESEPGIPAMPAQFDADPWLLNLSNGTLNLKTGALLPHDPAHLITKLATIHYDPEAIAPTWQAFLEDILEPEAIAYLQRAAGYSLTGDTREQCLFFLHGDGSNGKTTFINVMRSLLGDLAMQADVSAFLVKQGGAMSNDIACLHGARLVVASELAEGKRLNESIIKDATGQDRIRARFLYQESFEFQPTFKLWLTGNHKPEITGTDHGIWRRVKLVEFYHTIEDHQQDKQLPEKLAAELPGVLNWALAGLRAWMDSGLQQPQCVTTAVSKYRAESDHVALFLEDFMPKLTEWFVTKGALFDEYTRECDALNRMPIGVKTFAQRCLSLGLTEEIRKIDGKTVRGWNCSGYTSGQTGIRSVTGQLIEFNAINHR